MAFLKKPLKWTALGQEPSELKKNEGFKMDESPAPGHFDFMFRSTYEAIEELQQKAGEVKTVNNVQPDGNGNVLIPLPDTSKLYQKPASGIPKADLDTSVQSSLKKADDAAPLTELAKTNQTVAAHQGEDATLTTKGHTQLSNALNSVSEVHAATSKALKQAYDKAIEATGIASSKNLVIEKYTTPGKFLWTVPKGVKKVFVSACGGGGAGGSNSLIGSNGGITSFGSYLSLSGGGAGGNSQPKLQGATRGTQTYNTDSKAFGEGGSTLLGIGGGGLSDREPAGYGAGGSGAEGLSFGGSGGETCLDKELLVKENEEITLTIGLGGKRHSKNPTVASDGGNGVIIIKYIL